MSESESKLRSRRALLAGAAGGAAAIAANAALPVSRALAADQPLLVNVPNAATAVTSLEASIGNTGPVLAVSNTDSTNLATGLSGAAGAGKGVVGNTTNGTGVHGEAFGTGVGVRGQATTAAAAIQGYDGDASGAPSDLSFTGVFGYSEPGDGQTTFGTGVWGDSGDIGVVGTGGTGVLGVGQGAGTGVEGFSSSGYGLYVTGKVKLANRSGRLAATKGVTSVGKTVAGMTSSNIVIAVLQTAETGTWVRAAVARTNGFTVYFNRSLPTSSIVGWIVLN